MQNRSPGSAGRKNALVRWKSLGELALDEICQAAECLERRSADLVVLDGDPEMLFERGDEVDYGDRVELGHRAEQRRGSVHRLNAVADLQRIADNGLHVIE